jgi:cytoskeletal protein CcmA (bactofilin family)
MLRSETLFGKRDANVNSSPLNTSPTGQHGGSNLAKPAALPASSPATIAGAAPAASTNDVGSKLIVGPNIKLKGVEITDCDTLVVEGRVEATIDCRVMQIAEIGGFKGAAEVDIAEIHGEYDGDLTVRQKLIIHASGKVSGKIRYGKLVIEEGGQLAGDVQVGTAAGANARGLSVAKAVQ